MIQDTVKIHDRYAFELKLEYLAGKTERLKEYDVNLWFFFPESLTINENTYPSRLFYNDLKTHIRFSSPDFPLSEFTANERSPLIKCHDALNHLLESPDKKANRLFEQRIKIFGTAFRSSIGESISEILYESGKEKREKLLQDMIRYVNDIRDDFRSMKDKLQNENVKKKSIESFALVDEYFSNLLERNLLRLSENLNKTGWLLPEQKTILFNLASAELVYRQTHNFPAIPKNGSDHEFLLYRLSVLKKYVEGTLFLKTNTQREGRIIEQLLFSLAAGLAMLFATSVAFYSQYKYGNLTIPFFVVLIISYMLKDRIKEVIRIYFSGWMNRWFYDFKTNIYDSGSQVIGFIKESFAYSRPSDIPSGIRKMRRTSRFNKTDLSLQDESIFNYKMKIRIDSRKMQPYRQKADFPGITDVKRFNFNRFTQKMDDPDKDVYIVSKDGFDRQQGDRVYHINMVLQYIYEDKSLIKRFRIIMNRDGIKRIEKVLPKFKNH